MNLFISILLILFWADLTFAEFYRWVDDKGGVHYTDDISQIPERHRPGAEKIGGMVEKEGTKKEEREQVKKRDDPYRDRLGRGEDYWKGLVEQWRNKLKALHEKNESQRVKYNELTEKYNGSKSSVERAMLRNEREKIHSEMNQTKTQIEEAKIMLDKKIPEEAELYKAKPEWIKP